LTYPSFTWHPNGNFELSADAALVEADNKTQIGITNIAPVTEHERLLSMDNFLPLFEYRAGRPKHSADTINLMRAETD
jgi:hypothetical protein